MKIGISVTSHYAGVAPRHAATYMVERARAAAAAELDSLFVGDHHATPSPYLQNSVILGRLLAEWQGRRFGALYLLPLWHPVLLAEQTGTLASLSEGDFILQCGLGAGERQFGAMGARLKTRRRAFEESVDHLRRLWAGEEVSSSGHWAFSRARISPVPEHPPQIWVGASAEVAIERAARIGDGWIASPSLTLEELAHQIGHYRGACERFERPGVATLRADILVARTDAEAREAAEPVVAAGYRGFPPEALLVGSPATVAGQLAQRRDLGYEEVFVRNLARDQATALRSIELLADVRRHLEGS